MKQISTLAIIIIFLPVTLSAQGIFFRIGGGYGIPIATETIGTQDLQTNTFNPNGNITTYSSKNVSGSFGSGVNLNFAGGYRFNGNYAVEIQFQYLLGKKYETSQKYYDYSADNSLNGKSEDIIKHYSRAFLLSPSFIITPVTGNKVPYARFGFVFGLPAVYGTESYYYDLDGVIKSNREWEYTKGMAFGLQGAVGLNWKLNEKMDIFTEVNFLSMNYYAKEYELTKYDEARYTEVIVDLLPTLPVSVKNVLFKKEIDPNKQYPDDQPSEELRQARPFSSISLQAGLRYNL
jgi:hypothetical protein